MMVRRGSGECQVNVRCTSNLNLSLTLVDVKLVSIRELIGKISFEVTEISINDQVVLFFTKVFTVQAIKTFIYDVCVCVDATRL